MFNLLIGLNDGVVRTDRLFEYTDPQIAQPIAGKSLTQLKQLESLPALSMPEVYDPRFEAIARVGTIKILDVNNYDCRFVFTPDPSTPAFPIAKIQEIADQLGIRPAEFTRTHWAVKSMNLYKELFSLISLKPKLFDLPVGEATAAKQVAVMMPFSHEFNPVYEAIRGAVENAGMDCVRADEIWEKDKLLDDIIDLIYKSRVVLADLSGKNPNVFYETGIAHSVGKDTILIAQNIDDVPFDLRQLRTLTYLNNGEGLDTLSDKLTARLNTIITSS